jgi:hypothetical protein
VVCLWNSVTVYYSLIIVCIMKWQEIDSSNWPKVYSGEKMKSEK